MAEGKRGGDQEHGQGDSAGGSGLGGRNGSLDSRAGWRRKTGPRGERGRGVFKTWWLTEWRRGRESKTLRVVPAFLDG